MKVTLSSEEGSLKVRIDGKLLNNTTYFKISPSIHGDMNCDPVVEIGVMKFVGVDIDVKEENLKIETDLIS